ncbi:hypothetical protein [Streptomyces sp. NPDC052015]|uniref:hypothetical protein n=1 Tax=Streptomyces sp. NPDC052015 TaxID=3154755 RepID=UPI00343589C9
MSAATVYTVTNAMWAGAQGIELKSVALELEGDVDLRGFLGIDPAISRGLDQVRVHVDAEAPGSAREAVGGLVALVESRPIRDTLASPVGVVTTLA